MSDTIVATGFNDPGLAALRSQVGLKSDAIPYLLLPVKIETRFMKVDRPLVVKDPFPSVLEDLSGLEDYSRFDPSPIPPHEVLGRVKKISEKLKGINEQAATIQRLSWKDKEILSRQMQAVEKQNNVLTTRLSKWTGADEGILKQVRAYRNEVQSTLKVSQQTIEKLPTGTVWESSSCAPFIDTLSNLKDALEKISEKDLAGKDRKEKRKLFSLLDNEMNKIDQGLKELQEHTAVNMAPDGAQLKQIDSLLGKMESLHSKAEKNLGKLKSKYKSAEYTDRLALLMNKYNALHQDVQSRVKPKMQMMHELRRTTAREALVHIFEIRSFLKKQNQNPFGTYEEIRSTRKNLYDQLHSLREEVHKVIEGNDEDFEALQRAWDDTDNELEKYVQRVLAFRTMDAKEKAGLTRTVTHINQEYRKDLEGLKSSSKSAFRRLNNSTLEKSAMAYQQSLDKMNELNEQLSGSSGGLQTALSQVEEFSKNFMVAARDIQVLPEKAFADLQSASKKLEENIKKLSEKIQKSKEAGQKGLSSRLSDAGSLITSTVDAQMTDSLNRKDRFYDKLRSPIVFGTTTVTKDELWVRIYPDDIAIHTHEEELTQAEADDGKAYWVEILAAGEDQDLKLAAWRAIVASYGSQRASWIARTMKPDEVNEILLNNTLTNSSRSLMDANNMLQRLTDTLNGIRDRRQMFEVLGQAYPMLRNVYEKLKEIERDNATLLRKAHKSLLKVQSAINKCVKELKQVSVPERLAIGSRVQVLDEFINLFNATIKKFQAIGKVSSREIVLNASLAPIFPTVPIKEANWTKAPHSRVMPDRFAVITMRGGVYRHIVLTKNLPPNQLIVGIDPDTFNNENFEYDADGNLLVDDTIKWLTDFNEAVNKGMAVSITLSQEDVTQGFDKVFVLGVKDTTSLQGKNLLEDLIDNHHYIPQGASFVPVGTPTNNTEEGASGYRNLEDDPVLSFAVERNNELPYTDVADPSFPTDRERLAEGLGIDPEVFRSLDYNDRTEVSESLTINKALFHGTVGNYMEEGLDTLFTLDNINHTKAFFTNFVSARGFLPSIRVGTQPYGILPTTAFSRYSATANDALIPVLTKDDFKNYSAIQDELQTRFDIRLKDMLATLDTLWTSIRVSKVPYAGNTDPNDPQKHFMKMLGLQATSEEFYYRYGVNVASRQGLESETVNFNSDDPWSPVKVAETFRGLVLPGYYYKSDSFTDEQQTFSNPIEYLNYKFSRISDQFSKARVYTMRHLKDQSQLLGDFIDNRTLADSIVTVDNPTTGTADDKLKAKAELQNFIDWLVSQNPWDVHGENKFSSVQSGVLTERQPSKSVLFLLLRHSMLSAYADTILKILEFEGLTDQLTRKKMGMPKYYHQRYSGSFTYVTKWTYLFSKINLLNGLLGFEMNTGNSFYTYMNSLSGGNNGYLNRYISPETPFVFTNYANHTAHQPFMDELNGTRDAIRKLKDIPTARLEKLLSEHIDLCTYRLDAWKLGMVNKRLKSQRTNNPNGIFLGAYGWVESLKKGGVMKPAESIPSGLWKSGDAPVFTDADNLGFIHTPSLNHAITAAILRAGFHANEATAETENQMAVNLSSERVRIALNLLSGIRSGQSAAAILGYQFERGLHERYLHIPLELDQYIYDFREEFPLAVPVDENISLGGATLTQVVNGMDLLETAQDFIDSKGGPPNPEDSLYQSLKAFEADWWALVNNENINNASAAKKDAMLKEIDRMADAFDALGDLCVSESIYQVAKGNHVRSSSIMDKLAKGDIPSDIEIADTPRTGTIVTHKVGWFMQVLPAIDHVLTTTGTDSVPLSGGLLASAVAAAGASPAGWNSAFTPRALAEPVLNKWAGELIGDPAKIKCLVEYTIGETVTTQTITLAQLAVQPLDVLHLFGTGPLDGGAELNARIAAFVRKGIAMPPDSEQTADDIQISIRYTIRSNDWAANEYSFYEKAGYIQSLRSLITNSGTIAADDLLIPGSEEVPADQVRNLLPDELLTRVTNLQARLQQVYNDFNTFFTNEISLKDSEGHTFTNLQVDSLRDLLDKAAAFGIPGAVHDTVVSYGNTVGLSLLNAADGAFKGIDARLKQAKPDVDSGKNITLSSEVRVKALAEAAKKLVGKAFVVLPQFKLRNAADLALQINLPDNKGLLRSAPPFAMEEWSQSVGRVRQRLAVLDTVQMWSENFGTTLPDKEPIQFPFAQDAGGVSIDHWLGLEFPAGYTPSEDKLSLILMNTAAITSAPDTAKAGLLLDEWVEIIPNQQETTGITFNYDQPDAKAPNTLLLAVTPKETGSWSWDDLVVTLNDTLELAKNRAVEPEQLEDTVFGQILPGLLTEIVPPQLLPEGGDDSSDAQDNPLGLQVVTDFGVNNDTYVPENEDA